MAESGVIKSTTRVGYEVNHNTDAGLTENQKNTLSLMENGIRNKRNEEVVVVDDRGHVVGHDFGRGAKVAVSATTKKNMKDNIVTHNHPRSIGETGVRSFGSSLSPRDIATTISGDAREIRAVTPRYTFSMKRPANGWGMTSRQAADLMARASRSVTIKNKAYLNEQNWKQSRLDMAEATHFDQVNKEFVRLAKKYYGVDIIYRHRKDN